MLILLRTVREREREKKKRKKKERERKRICCSVLQSSTVFCFFLFTAIQGAGSSHPCLRQAERHVLTRTGVIWGVENCAEKKKKKEHQQQGLYSSVCSVYESEPWSEINHPCRGEHPSFGGHHFCSQPSLFFHVHKIFPQSPKTHLSSWCWDHYFWWGFYHTDLVYDFSLSKTASWLGRI